MSFRSSGVHPAGCARPVLLVEDNDDIREMMREALEIIDRHLVITACHGQEALDLLRSGVRLPGVVVLDLTMPVMNGYQLIHEIRRDPELEELPLVVVSASYRTGDRLDVQRILKKPVFPEDLAHVVRELCPSCARLRRKRTTITPA
jgi:CheY-like chemotaxis protein